MATDADLVARALAGDTSAFGDLYDAYAPRLLAFCTRVLGDPHEAADAVQDTFVLAVQRLGQLREPDALRAWLYAIARNECTRRGRARARAVPTAEPVPVTAEGPNDDVGDVVASEQYVAWLWAAAEGLDERDRLLLELNVRHGLEGAELAEAAGIPTGQISMATGRMRERSERALGAMLVARQGRADCDELQRVLTGWDGTFDVLWRKRVARHVDGCPTCTDRRAALLAPLGSLAALPFLPPPGDLRARVVDAMAGASSGAGPAAGPPPADRVGRRRALVVAAVLALLVVVLVAALGRDRGSEPVASGAGKLGEKVGAVASTTTSPSGSSSTVPATGSTVTTTAPATTPTAPAAGSSTTSTTEPELTAPTDPGSDPSTPTVVLIPPETIDAPDAPPTVGSPSRDQAGPLRTASCPGTHTTAVSASASDDVGLAAVTLVWSQAGGSSGRTAMHRTSASNWVATLGPFAVGGDVTYRVEARDTAGARTTSPSATVGVDPCPG